MQSMHVHWRCSSSALHMKSPTGKLTLEPGCICLPEVVFCMSPRLPRGVCIHVSNQDVASLLALHSISYAKRAMQ